MKNILFIGGTGYIGGPIFSRFIERQNPDYSLTALVRSPEKAEKLRKLNIHHLNVVIGTHNDAPLVERLAEQADVVFSLADSDDLQAAKSIMRGLKRRFETTKVKPTLIHMSGIGCLGDGAEGAFAADTVYNDLDIAQIESLPATQSHRNVDLAIVEADEQGYAETYIVLPGLVFGAPNGILAREGVQNPANLGVGALINVAFARGAAGMRGEGKNIIGVVDVTEVADLVELVYNSIGRQIGHGRNGYHFLSAADVPFEKFAEVIERRAGKRRAFTQEELDTYFPNLPALHAFIGDNGRAESARARALGWKPVKGAEEFLIELRDDIEHWKV
ncbi:hypothetical protein C8R46DRAFT_1270737 [Mycena filopes]|nr:hypothetical protein C8R46DRAFT_1270737 [Mycena filopes]